MISVEFDAVIPVLCVALAGLVVLLAEAFRDKGEQMPIGGAGHHRPGRRPDHVRAVAGLTQLLGSTRRCGTATPPASAWSPPTTSRCSSTSVLVVVGILTVIFSSQTIERDGLPAGEYYAIMLFAIVGMMLMAQATDLLLIFLALETMSIAVYVLTGIRRDQQQSTEAAFKYFLLGAFASSFFLYGIAFLYGVTGSTNLDRIGSVIAAQSMSGNPMILLGVGLLIVGFAFKVAAVPFHMWSPDAYEGAPAVVTGFMSTGVKAAAVAAFVARVPVGARADDYRLGAGACG